MLYFVIPILVGGLTRPAGQRSPSSTLRGQSRLARRRSAISLNFPFHVCVNLSEILSGKTVVSVEHGGENFEPESLFANVVEFRLRGMKRQSDRITARQKQMRRNYRGNIMFA